MSKHPIWIALALAVSAASPEFACAQSATNFDQQWSERERALWYGATQGSRLLPLAWFRALERARSEARFADFAHLAGYGYLERPAADPLRPLPIGFVVDGADASWWEKLFGDGEGSEKWVGLNCSACHTGRITSGGREFRVDGAPTLADFQTFFYDLNDALVATRDDPAKFARFAQHVAETDGGSAEDLERRFRELVDFVQTLADMNRAPDPYGYGRLDAVGFIFNKVARVVNGPDATGNPPDAPVSYPFIWNVPQHDKVQWNGIAANRKVPGDVPILDWLLHRQDFDIGALGRNTGEVIGVFADIRPTADFPKGSKLGPGFESSVRVRNLVAIEQLLGSLRPPLWPSELGGIVDEKRARGEELFDDHCVRCHAKLDRTDLKTPIVAQMAHLSGEHPIGTDPWMACNAYTYTAPSGVLLGARNQFFTGTELEREANLSDLLTVLIAGALWKEKGEVVKTGVASFFGLNRPPEVLLLGTPEERAAGLPPSKAARLEQCMTDPSELLAYKGRPLNGIWATAPYLHNGSVANLWELLLPPAQRMRSFHVGSPEFDAKHVGYVTDEVPGKTFEFRTADAAGKPIDGNSNAGHDYGNSALNDEERWALIEYMKSL